MKTSREGLLAAFRAGPTHPTGSPAIAMTGKALALSKTQLDSMAPFRSTIVFLALALQACVPSRHVSHPSAVPARSEISSSSEGGDWMTENRVEAALRREAAALSQSTVGSTYLKEWQELQHSADVLLQIDNSMNITVRRCSVSGLFPKPSFPAADLKGYLSTSGKPQPLGLVVVLIPSLVIDNPGRPTLLAVCREMDEALRRAGDKRRVFETDGNHQFYKLDSAVD